MRNRLGVIGLILLAIGVGSPAPRLAFADTALGTSKWSLELGTDLGSGDNDMSFAVRRHCSASKAFRFSVAVDANNVDGEGPATDTGATPGKFFRAVGGQSLEFSVQWMHFASLRDNVTATFSLGPVLEVRRNYERYTNKAQATGYTEQELLDKSTSYGLAVGLGAEWFFTSRLSLGGQSGIRATTGTGTNSFIGRTGNANGWNNISEIRTENDVKEITTANTRIQLTAYF